MGITISSNAVFNQTNTPSRSKVINTTINWFGLKPNSNYDFKIDGVLCNFLAKQWGKDLGAQLTSDSNGKLTMVFHYDVENFVELYAMQNRNINSQNVTQVLGPDNHVTVFLELQLVSPFGGIATRMYPLRGFVAPEAVLKYESMIQ